jgi:hypothetical protein
VPSAESTFVKFFAEVHPGAVPPKKSKRQRPITVKRLPRVRPLSKKDGNKGGTAELILRPFLWDEVFLFSAEKKM